MVQPKENTHNAWIAFDSDNGEPSVDIPYPKFVLRLSGEQNLFAAISEGDRILMTRPDGQFTRVGRVLRLRSNTESTTIYFDSLLAVDSAVSLATTGLALPSSDSVNRVQWADFVEGLTKLTNKKPEEIPLIDHPAYIRELLQLAVMDDLLGPANGPREQIVDMGVRDRYLVGKLAPRKKSDGDIEGLEGPLALEDEEEPNNLEIHTGRHDPGAEFGSTDGQNDAEAEAADEIDTTSNQSLIPSSFGMTFCVDGDVESIEVEARWGRYVRDYDTEIYKTKQNKETGAEEQVGKAKIWQRIPSGGKIVLNLKDGRISPQAPDTNHPEVCLQGIIRHKNDNGDRLVTLFLVNAQDEPEQNKDTAWVFQPEIIVCARDGAEIKKAIFRKRPAQTTNADDPEHDALEMIYREQVEFAVGHGIAVHAETMLGEPSRAVKIRTAVMPQYEIPVTETPGTYPDDRPAMKRMTESGYLNMKTLAGMEQNKLVETLSILTEDYKHWIDEQQKRIGTEVIGHDKQAGAALDRCRGIHDRLVEGVNVLGDLNNDAPLKAFRLANRAMAGQRIHSLYALARRRGESVTVTDFENCKHHTWRPFQLAFVLLSIPSLANPMHKDRSKPMEAYADLLWFPTGGGKTEAYLGIAAFVMAIRRLQGNLGGLDNSRGLTVIMRYTLRLLTLQQFQRGSTLMCAMETLRREAAQAGDDTLGKEPFTIGLWIGNKVTPGTTKVSEKTVKDIRDPDKFSAGDTTPAQLTSCPWCGSKIEPGRDITVDMDSKQTILYCGDQKADCAFSKGKSSKNRHPGLPVLVVDEELYHRPPSMMIATVDKFAMMAWRGEVRTLFGRVQEECPRHGLLWPEADCTGKHNSHKSLPRTETRKIKPIRPPDLIIQDEFHLINGPLGTMVGLYETAVDELSSWKLDGQTIKPKIVASTATVRKAKDQMNSVFMRRVAIFPPHGLDVKDCFFSVQRPVQAKPGQRYMGICSPGSSRPAILIRVYTAFLTAAQALFNRFGKVADPYLTTVGYFNSLRELGGMRRLSEDDVHTRCNRVEMTLVQRPGLAQRFIKNIIELTSRVSSRDILHHLGQLEVKCKALFDDEQGKYIDKGGTQLVDVVLATNMFSVGVDVNRLGLMVVNGQPKGTAEYIQATSRVGRSFPGLVCTVLAWARPRDLSHYETFEHYHATFYKHVEAQSVTPFSPRAMDRGLTGTLLSAVRLENKAFNPNLGAGVLDKSDMPEIMLANNMLTSRAWNVTDQSTVKEHAASELKERIDTWVSEASQSGRKLAYEKKGPGKEKVVALLKRPGIQPWDNFTVPMSMREVEPGIRLVMNTKLLGSGGPAWIPRTAHEDDEGAME